MTRALLAISLLFIAMSLHASEVEKDYVKPYPPLKLWGEWIGGGSAGYIYNSYRSNFEACPPMHACVGSCFRKTCDPFSIGKGRYARGMFCQYVGNSYETVDGESAYYGTMASCAPGDYIVGMGQGNFTVFSSFCVLCGRGSSQMYADHSQQVASDSFCPQNYVAVSRCYELSQDGCKSGTLRCAPLVRSNFTRSDQQILHPVAGAPGNERCVASEHRNVHPLSVSVPKPRAFTVGMHQDGSEFIAAVDGTNKITQVSLLSPNKAPSNFRFHESFSRVLSKSNFTSIAASSKHLYVASTAQNVTRIYRMDHDGQRVMLVLGGEIGGDLKGRMLCPVTFLNFVDSEDTLFIGQPHGYLKWSLGLNSIVTIGSPVCSTDDASTLAFGSPLCIAKRRNQTLVVERSGRVLREHKGTLVAFRSVESLLSQEDSMQFQSCSYDITKDTFYMATTRCVLAASLRNEFPEITHAVGNCARASAMNDSIDVFHDISHLEFHDGQLLIADCGAETIYSLENAWALPKVPQKHEVKLERSPTLPQTEVAIVFSQNHEKEEDEAGDQLAIESRITDIRQFLHGQIMVATTNNLHIFEFENRKWFSKSGAKGLTFDGQRIEDIFSKIYVAAARDNVVYFADSNHAAIFAADIISGRIFSLSDGSVNHIRAEDMIVSDTNELCVVSKDGNRVALHCIDTTTKAVRTIFSDLTRFLPDEGKYSISSYREALYLASGRRVVRVSKDDINQHPAIIGVFEGEVLQMTVDAGSKSLLMLTDKGDILSVSLEETHFPRATALVTVSRKHLDDSCLDDAPAATKSKMKPIALTCHDATKSILLVDPNTIFQAKTAQPIREYVADMSSADNLHKNPSAREQDTALGQASNAVNGSVHLEGKLRVSIYQLKDNGARNRPIIDVVIHGDSWNSEAINADPKAFIASIFPQPVFSQKVIDSSSALILDPSRVRITIGHDAALKIPREYADIGLTSNFSDKVTTSGNRPYFLHATSMPRIQIDHGTRVFPAFKYTFLVFAILSLTNSNPIGHVFIAIAQGTYIHPTIRSMTKPAIHTMSPFYSTIARVDFLPVSIGRILSNTAIASVLFPALYFLWGNINKAADTKQHVMHEFFLRHATSCILMFTHTSMSHAAYVGLFAKPSLYWIVYFFALVAGLGFIAYGLFWLRHSKIQWKVNPYIRDPITPTGLWCPIEKIRFHGIYFNGFRESFTHSNLIALAYYQLILLCASVRHANPWVYRTCTALNVIVCAALSVFYVFFMPMRWRILNLNRGMTLNAVCVFLLMDSSGSSEFTTALLALFVIFTCAIEGVVEVFTVWKESTIWHKIVGELHEDQLQTAKSADNQTKAK